MSGPAPLPAPRGRGLLASAFLPSTHSRGLSLLSTRSAVSSLVAYTTEHGRGAEDRGFAAARPASGPGSAAAGLCDLGRVTSAPEPRFANLCRGGGGLSASPR